MRGIGDSRAIAALGRLRESAISAPKLLFSGRGSGRIRGIGPHQESEDTGLSRGFGALSQQIQKHGEIVDVRFAEWREGAQVQRSGAGAGAGAADRMRGNWFAQQEAARSNILERNGSERVSHATEKGISALPLPYSGSPFKEIPLRGHTQVARHHYAKDKIRFASADEEILQLMLEPCERGAKRDHNPDLLTRARDGKQIAALGEYLQVVKPMCLHEGAELAEEQKRQESPGPRFQRGEQLMTKLVSVETVTPSVKMKSGHQPLLPQGHAYLVIRIRDQKFSLHPAWKRDLRSSFQSQQSRFISTYSSGNQPANPDLSSASSSLDQDKLDPFTLVADELALLGNKLRSMVAAEVPRLAEAAEYFFKLGVEGKRFRPMVLLLMASALTAGDTVQHAVAGSQRERQQQIAEITEMIHVASLLHDDVLDHADTRRGIQSLNQVMGNKLAVLAGDFLLARASVALASLHNTEVVELLSKVLEHLVTGEIMQLTTETQEICSMEYYMQKTFYKTASLMANSCKSIALLADQPREVANLAFEYGRHLGLAFQLVDDSLDFIGSKASLGKPTLADLAQGIATAPVLFALDEHPQIYDLVNRKFRKSGDVDQALEMVRNSQGILRTQQLAAHHAHQAALAIAALPPSSSERVQLCRRALTELTEHVITRSK